MAPSILWFRRDLRLLDHPALHEAVRFGGQDGVVPVFVIDDTFLALSGPTRVEFLISCLEELSNLMGAPLVLRVGNPVDVIPELANELGANDVVVTGDTAPAGIRRDNAVREALEHQGRRLHSVSSAYAVLPGTVRSEKDLPFKVFTAFRGRWDVLGPHGVLEVPKVDWQAAPSTSDVEAMRALADTRQPSSFGDLPDGPAAKIPPGGEEAALKRLEEFVSNGVDSYGQHRDVMSIDDTSGLSPYMCFGCIHPRTVLAAVQGPGEGRTIFRSEICWREFYADVLFHNPQSVDPAMQRQLANLEWDTGSDAEKRFRRWARGEMGIPIADAAMRQLLSKGAMHNRSRRVTASSLVKHRHLDWRWGPRWFMRRLVDGDVASNQHGWQHAGGTGTDAALFHRIFNPVLQAERFDPEGISSHRWIPELAGIEAPRVLQSGGGVTLLDQSEYPASMIDLKTERAEALRRFGLAKDIFRVSQ